MILGTSDNILENVTEHSRQDLPQKGFDGFVKGDCAPHLELLKGMFPLLKSIPLGPRGVAISVSISAVLCCLGTLLSSLCLPRDLSSSPFWGAQLWQVAGRVSMGIQRPHPSTGRCRGPRSDLGKSRRHSFQELPGPQHNPYGFKGKNIPILRGPE